MRRVLLSLFTVSGRLQTWVITICVLAFVGSFAGLLYRFWLDSTVLVPARGGTYIEGSVGEVLPWNPWFTLQNDVNRDIVSLVFSGLLKYDPVSGQIIDDLATMSVSDGGKVYTLTLHDGLQWHDSTPEKPHYVTADDVLFTFQTIQDPEFPNPPLRENFAGVTVEKVNDHTVTFTLDEPYAYFPTNLTFGLLPKRSFEGIPVSRLSDTIDFGLHPIGAGPYRLKSFTQTEISSEVTLEKFQRPLPEQYRLERVVFRVFPDFLSLLSDLGNLDAIRLVPQSDQGHPVIPSGFQSNTYSLPQYVALFFNLDHKIVADQQLRIGLQLGTNKQAIADAVGNAKVVDTPLLEIDTSDWHYQFDANAAQGSLYESQWYFPEKIRLQALLERKETNRVGFLKVPEVTLLTTGSTLAINGLYSDTGPDPRVGGLPVTPVPTASGSWVVQLPTVKDGTGALVGGDNLIRVTDEHGKILDSASVYRAMDNGELSRAQAEQDLLDRFLASRGDDLPAEQRITANDMTLESGFLRLRRPEDSIGIRENAAGRTLHLTLLTSPSPPEYRQVANAVAKQWRELGVDVSVVVPETRSEFEAMLLRRQYDVLLYGQSLLNNLDAYPYWHSSDIQRETDNDSDLRLDAYNLSQYASSGADVLLEEIRSTNDEAKRLDAIAKLRETLKSDVPAIILYSPVYTYAHRDDILGVDLGHLAMHADRMHSLSRWYVRQERVFKPGIWWTSFFDWLGGEFTGSASVPPPIVPSGAQNSSFSALSSYSQKSGSGQAKED